MRAISVPAATPRESDSNGPVRRRMASKAVAIATSDGNKSPAASAISYPGPPKRGMKPIRKRPTNPMIAATVWARDRRTQFMARLRVSRGRAAVGRRRAVLGFGRHRFEDQAEDFVHPPDQLDIEIGAHLARHVVE